MRTAGEMKQGKNFNQPVSQPASQRYHENEFVGINTVQIFRSTVFFIGHSSSKANANEMDTKRAQRNFEFEELIYAQVGNFKWYKRCHFIRWHAL